MRLALAVFTLALLVPAAHAAPLSWTNKLDVGAALAAKDLNPHGHAQATQPQGLGEDIATPIPIPSLPFSTNGYSCGYMDDYEVVCPYGPFVTPDVVYSYTPATDQSVHIDLCGSYYDTKVFVFDGSPATVVACNDDACGYNGWQSSVPSLSLTAGHTYYIVVDGYGGDCGAYTLNVTENAPCVTCLAADEPEPEPICYDGFLDTFDGGCNSTPPVFAPVACGEICGTAGTYTAPSGIYRDTDWYVITVGPGNYSYSGVGDRFDLQLLVITAECPASILSGIVAPACQSASLSFTGPGTFYLWAGPYAFTGVPCGSKYRLSISGPGIMACEATPSRTGSWGALKTLYR